MNRILHTKCNQTIDGNAGEAKPHHTTPHYTKLGEDRPLCLSCIFGIQVGGLLSEKVNLRVSIMDKFVADFVSSMGLALPLAILVGIRAGEMIEE